MIDWHSHVLPAMDDGSRNVDESIRMLEAMKEQGVDIVIATPHFYANENSVDEFLERRKQSFEQLREKMGDGADIIRLGAEVRYYPGISRMDGLEKLVIENTNLLLLEMPFTIWTKFVLQELFELANLRGLKVIIAHIERYMMFQDKYTVAKLCENGLLMQVNATFFQRFGSRTKAMRLLGEGFIHFVGSDCHNMTSRAPNVDSAYELIKRRFGEDYTAQMIEYGYSTLKKYEKKLS